MRTNRQSTGSRPGQRTTFWILAVGLGIGGALHMLLAGENTDAWAQPNDPRQVFEDASAAFERGEYRIARDRMLRLDDAPTGIDPRRFTWLRAASVLRQSRFEGTPDAQRVTRARQALERLLGDPLDTWAARGYAELVRANGNAAVDARLDDVLQYWERRTDVDAALPGYVDLAEALLGPDGSMSRPDVLRRMWNNIVTAGAPVATLESLGPRLLGVPASMPYGGYVGFRWAPDQDLQRRVAEDLLARARDPWVLAHAAFVAGRVAASAGDYVAAVEHYRRAVEAVDIADGRYARDAQNQLDLIVRPSVDLNTPPLLRPGSSHRFAIQWRNLRAWTLRVRRIDPTSDLRALGASDHRITLADWVTPGAGEVVWTVREEDAVEIRARDGATKAKPRHVPRSKTRWLDPLEPGVYAVELEGETFDGTAAPSPSRAVVVVSGMGILERGLRDAATGSAQRELWVVDMRDGEPRAGVELALLRGGVSYRSGDTRVDWLRQTARSADDGRILLPEDGAHDDLLLVRGEVGGHPLLFAGRPNGSPTPLPERIDRGLVWTDRPLYRPGETVHLQVFHRGFDPRSREFAVPAGETVSVRIDDTRGETVLERKVTLDANGSAELAWDVPRAAGLGAHAITVNDGDRSWVARATFEVGEVRLPEFTVDVELDTERRFVVGDTLEVDVRAEYLFGGPVRGQVVVTARRDSVHPIWPMPRRMPWLDDRASFAPRIWPGPQQGPVVVSETLVLDEDGRATLRIPTDDREPSAFGFRYVIEAEVTDASRRTERGQGTVTVGRTELTAQLRAVRHVVAPGDRAWIHLRIQDAMGRGVAHEGTVRVVRVDDPDERIGDERTIRTDDDGDARFDFEPERTGHYRVTYETVDGRGFDVTAEAVVWVADPRTRDIVSRDDAVQLIVDEDEILGDTARVLLLSDTPGATILLTRTHALGSTSEVVRLRGTSRLLEIPLDAVHRPQFEMTATRVADFRVHHARALVTAPDASRLLDLQLTFEQDAVLPGTTTPLRVRATDANGDPVETVLSFAVVDEALLAIAPRADLDPLRVFTPARRIDATPPMSMGSRMGGYVFVEPDAEDVENDERLGQSRRIDGEGESRAEASKMSLADGMAAPSVARQMPMAEADGGAAPFTPGAVRTDFRTTALWRVGVHTDANGEATIDVPLAESLTSWNALALAIDPLTRIGTAETTIRTRKPIMVRLQHPRVFRGADAFTVAAIVHNETDADTEALVQFEAGDLTDGPQVESVLVPAHGQARVEFALDIPIDDAQPVLVRDGKGRIVGVEPSSIDVQVAVKSEAGEDALRRPVALHPFGTGLHVASMRVLDEGSTTLTFEPIGDRLPGSETVTLTVAPSMLSAAIDALPGLAEFPYGCVEQTLSRFVPAVAVRAVAERVGVDSDRFDPELDAKIADGLARIEALQNGSGGWSWWGGAVRPTNPYVTAYALRALAEAHAAGVDVDRDMMRRGRDALRAVMTELETRPDDLAYALVALLEVDRAVSDASRHDEAMQRWARSLFDARDERTAYARALTATVLHAYGQVADADLVLRHLENDVRTNERVGTAHWGETGSFWWRGRGAVETTSFVLQAIVAVDPDHPRREQVARWLVLNRRGHMWDSTRSSAHALYALCDHLEGSEALTPDYELVATQDGRELVRVQVDDVIDGGGRFELAANTLDGGPIELRLTGRGRAWVTFDADAFSRARTIDAAGHGIFVRREVVRLDPQRTLGAGVVDIEVPMDDGDAVESGDRLRIRLHLTLDHDLDFVMIEDPRVAGAEPIDPLSGHFVSNAVSGHREIRDDRTAFFVDALAEGEHVIEYEVVAESPGSYHVAPARAMAMYLTDMAGHSSRTTVDVVAAPDPDVRGR